MNGARQLRDCLHTIAMSQHACLMYYGPELFVTAFSVAIMSQAFRREIFRFAGAFRASASLALLARRAGWLLDGFAAAFGDSAGPSGASKAFGVKLGCVKSPLSGFQA